MNTQDRESIVQLTSILHDICAGIVSKPERVHVQLEKFGLSHDILIHCAPEDIGRLLGTRGGRYQAMSDLVKAVSLRTGVSVALMRIPDIPVAPPAPLVRQPRRDFDWLLDLAERMGKVCFERPEAVEVTTAEHMGMTHLVVHVHEFEREGSIRALTHAFHLLLESVGLAMKHPVRCAIIPDRLDQPKTADGRFCKA